MDKSIAIWALLCVMLQAAQARAPGDVFRCELSQLDQLEAAQGINVLDDSYPYKIALNSEDQVRRCKEMKDAMDTLLKFHDHCLAGLTKQVFGKLIKTRSEYIDLHCRPDSEEFKEYLEAFKCVAENAFDDVRKAEKKTVERLVEVFYSDEDDQTRYLHHACCRVFEAKSRFVGATKEQCAKYEKTYANYVDSYTKESIPELCPKELKCDNLEALKIDETANRFKFKSLLVVVYGLLEGNISLDRNVYLNLVSQS